MAPKPFLFTLLRDMTIPGDVWETTTYDRHDGQDATARAQALLDEPRMAEECGLDSFSAGDHMYDTPDPLIDCMAAAAATTTLRVSQTVLANDFRHPAQVAKQIASIDVFSGGRAQLGIGAAYNQSEYRQQGLEFDPPKVRVARLRESVQIIKALLTSDEPVTFHGEYYNIDGLMGMPRPVQKPNPPICIGGGGKEMLKMAAEFADVVDIMTKDPYPSGLTRDPRQFTRESVLEKIDWVKQCAGDRFAGLILGLVLFRFYRTDDRARAAQVVHAEMDAAYRMHGDDNGFTLTHEELLDSPYFAIGSDDEIIEHFVQLRRDLGLTNFLVFKGYLDELKPMIGRLRAAGE